MSRRAGNNVCLFCQLRRPSPWLNLQTRFTTRALASSTAPSSAPEHATKQDSSAESFTPHDLQRQLNLFSVSETFERRILSIEPQNKRPSYPHFIERKLFGDGYLSNAPSIDLESPKESPSSIAAIDLIRFQLQSASSIEQIIRILTYHLRGSPDSQSIAKAQVLATNPELTQTIRMQLSRFSIGRQLNVLGLLMSRFCAYGQRLSRPLLLHALNISAVEHLLPVFCQFLKAWLTSIDFYSPMSSSELASILTSLNFGIVRSPDLNDRHQRKDTVLPLLYTPSSPSSNIYSLDQLLSPGYLSCLGPWLATLVTCRANEDIWREWQLVELGQRWSSHHASSAERTDIELQRNALFIMALFQIGHPERAWKVYQASTNIFAAAQHLPHSATDDVDAYGIHRSVWNALISNWSSKPALSQPLQDALNQSLLNRLADLCTQVEAQLGATWHKPADDAAQGSHTISWADSSQQEPIDLSETNLPAFLQQAFGVSSDAPSSSTLQLLQNQLTHLASSNAAASPVGGHFADTASSEADALELALVKPWGYKSMAEALQAFRARTVRLPRSN